MHKKEQFSIREVALLNNMSRKDLISWLIDNQIVIMYGRDIVLCDRIETCASYKYEDGYTKVIFNTHSLDDIKLDKKMHIPKDDKYLSNKSKLTEFKIINSVEDLLLSKKTKFQNKLNIIVYSNKLYNDVISSNNIKYIYNTNYINKIFNTDIAKVFHKWASENYVKVINEKFNSPDGDNHTAGRQFTGNKNKSFKSLPLNIINSFSKVEILELIYALELDYVDDLDLSKIFNSNFLINICEKKLRSLCNEYDESFIRWNDFRKTNYMDWGISSNGRAWSLFHNSKKKFLAKVLKSKDNTDIYECDIKQCGFNILQNILDYDLNTDDIYVDFLNYWKDYSKNNNLKNKSYTREEVKELFIQQGYGCSGSTGRFMRLHHNEFYIKLRDFRDQLLLQFGASIQAYCQFMESQRIISISKRLSVVSRHDSLWLSENQLNLVKEIKDLYNAGRSIPAKFTLEKI